MLPDYVLKYKTKGYKIIKRNNSYMLYKTTSNRVPGKKYPQAVSTYLGVITVDGLIPAKTRINEIKAYEFGKCMYLLKVNSNILKDYKVEEIIKGILIAIHGTDIFQYHYENSYLSIIYPNIKIDLITSVDQETSRLLIKNIDKAIYSEMFNITAVVIEQRWYLANLTLENKKIMNQLNICLMN